ncbi:Protein BABY BOOM, putative [Ricinus communis]|uniref:Protein BABY BOOM, putative n=2 Tax=Ricinus communis TaxID=3988 RepID=B9TAM3_RICCO|nr:Protein BABY BOOM, putative [Ricinus communis]
MKHMTRQEFVASIRRKSSGFSRGASMYRGVTRHHQHGRWQARIGRVAGNKDLYLGTFSTEEEAAEAYDIAAIKFRGLNAVTNFDMSRYDVKSILESNTLPIGGGAAKRLKEAQAIESSRKREEMIALGSSFQYGSSSSGRLQAAYPLMPFEQPQPLLTLHDQDISHYTQDSSFHQNYLQTQLHLHQQSGSNNYLQQSTHHNPQLYNSYMQNNPALLHGLFNMGSSSSIMETNGNSSGSYSGGYLGNGLGMASNSTGSNAVGPAEEVALVKVDYDMPSGGYGNWSGDSVQGSNPGGVFTMWND